MKRPLNNLHDHTLANEYVKLFDDIRVGISHCGWGKGNVLNNVPFPLETISRLDVYGLSLKDK